MGKTVNKKHIVYITIILILIIGRAISFPKCAGAELNAERRTNCTEREELFNILFCGEGLGSKKWAGRQKGEEKEAREGARVWACEWEGRAWTCWERLVAGTIYNGK